MMFTAPERLEWVEIIEPRSHERMYANLQTGECVWEPPPGVAIKRCYGDQWWELFDEKTSRFYYYNVSSQQTVWHRPSNVDIIPLAKLQTLKQTTDIIPLKDADVEGRHPVKEETTQTSHPIQKATEVVIMTVARVQRTDEFCMMVTKSVIPKGIQIGVSRGKCLHQFKDDSTKSLYIHSTTTSPTVSRKHLHCHHHSHTSDGEMPVASSGAVGHRFAPAVSRGSHSSQSNSGIYGYVYRDAVLSIPQRSLESPRASEGLIDLDRSKPEAAQRGLDLMSRSYHSHYHSAYLYRPDVSPSDAAEKSLDVGRRGGTSSYGNMPDVLAAQATPRQKPRAFPRTNPTFVGVQRMDGYSTYRRINERTASSMSAGSAPKFYDTAVATDPLYNRTSIQMPSLQDYPGYPTLRQKHFMNHSFDVANSYNHLFDNDGKPDGGASQLTSQQMALLSSVTSGDATLVAPARVKSRLAAIGLQSDDTQLRRNSEPFYVNLPVRDGEPVSRSSNGTTDTSTDTLKCSGRNARDSLELQMKVTETCSNGEAALESVIGVEAGVGGGGGDDGYSDRSSVFSSTPPVKAPSVGQSPAWIRPEFLCHPDYPQKSLVSEWLERGPEDGNQTPIFDGQLFRGQKLLRQLQPIKFYSESDGDGQHFVRPSEPSPVSRDNDTELHSLTEFDIEEFATKHLNDHRKGFLGKLLPVESVLTWSKEAIKKPLIRTPNKTVKKEAPEILKKIQLYMGDRTMRGVTAEQLLLDVVIKGWSLVELRDEIFIQLCRQTTKNPTESSVRRGFEMLCICLSFFPPSYMFLPYLQMHLNGPFECSAGQSVSSQVMSSQSAAHQVLICRKHCQRRLEKVLQTGAKKGLCKPTMEEVDHARKSIYMTSMFGSTLSEVMVMQSSRFPNNKLPWIQTVLSELVLRLNGVRTEGIFRVPGDIDEVNSLKVQIDTWNSPVNCKDPSVPASLLKLWYRELYEPLIPYEFYFECIENYADPDGAFSVVNQLPTINKNVLLYLVRFLQVFAAPENVVVTKMDINNLSMVMAPNFLRCRLTDPKIVFENARKEMGFVRTLIQHLDTNEMEGIV